MTITAVAAAGAPAFPPVTVSPGDVVVGDLDGVVVVPAALLDRVVEQAERAAAADERVMADLRSGSSVADAFGRHRGR